MSIILSKKEGYIKSIYNIYYRYYRASNKRATIICIHGILSDSRLFENFASILSRNGFDVYAIDLPGYGLSDTTINNTNFDDVIVSIHSLVTSINDKPFLLGFSLGSIYAAYYASRYDDIAGLILISPLLHPIRSMLPEYANGIMKLYQDNPEAVLNILEYIELDNDKYDYISNNPLCLKYYPLSYLFDIFVRATDNKVLDEIDLPVLILYGRYDKFTDIKQVRETHRLLASKNKTLEILDTDHWLFDTFFYNGKDSKVITIIERWIDAHKTHSIINTFLFFKPFIL